MNSFNKRILKLKICFMMNFKILKFNNSQKKNKIKILVLNRFNKKINHLRLINKIYKNNKIKKLIVVIKQIIYILKMNNFNRF